MTAAVINDMPAPKQLTPISQLRAVLNDALDVLEDELEVANLPPLGLEDVHPLDDPEYLISPRAYEARKTAVAALGTLKAIVTPASTSTIELVYTSAQAGAMEYLTTKNIPSLLGDKEVHVEDLGKKIDMDPNLLGRLMRLMASRHWFKETKPSVFANTRLGKLLVAPSVWYSMCRGVFHYVSKAAAALPAFLEDPVLSRTKDLSRTPFSKAFGVDVPFFPWLNDFPEQRDFLIESMAGFSGNSLPAALADYPWEKLGTKTLVDVGGGQGKFTLPLLKKYPQFKLVLQDQEGTLLGARKNFEANLPEALEDERVVFMPHDFFKPQPAPGEDSVFILRLVMHDYYDEVAIQILSHIAAVMKPGMKLLICEDLVPTAAAQIGSQKLFYEPGDYKKELIGINNDDPYQARSLPPIIPKVNGTFRTTLDMDIVMFCLFGAQERTSREYTALISKAGLKVTGIWPTRSASCIIEAEVGKTNVHHRSQESQDLEEAESRKRVNVTA